MRILFVLKQMGYLRHFDTVVEGLADRGHVVRLASQDRALEMPEALSKHPNVSAVASLKKRGDAWQEFASLIRRAGDYVRYLEPPYADARKLRARAFEKMMKTLSQGVRTPDESWSDVALGLTADERARLKALFEKLEDTIPSDVRHEEFLRREAPDLLLITPLIDLGSGQADFIKSARALGIPSALLLFSWDNLSTKGGIHVIPDAVYVWNERQRREAIELHDVPNDRIHVTGAPRFDRFFATRPATSRAEYCQGLGLDPAKPIVTYLGSSKFVSEHERSFIKTWIAGVRGSADPELAGCNIVVKPHPDLHRDWDQDDQTSWRWKSPERPMQAVVTRPFSPDRAVVVRSAFTGTQFLYDCLYHSAAVVGLNTSAEIEAAILGKPVCTIRLPDASAAGQTGTLHFHYLLRAHGGFVEEAHDLNEHFAQLTAVLGGRVDHDELRRFAESFVRPQGLETAATDVLVDAIESRFRDQVAQRDRTPATVTFAVAERDDVHAGDAPAPTGEFQPQRVLLDYRPEQIWLIATSEMERRWRAKTCAKEPWTVAWIERYLQPGDVFYDIGANVGAFSLIAAKRLKNNVSIVAFEPGYATFAHLCDNIVANGCESSICPVPLPLAARTGLAGFKYRTLDPGQSRHALIERGWGKPVKKEKTQTRYTQPVLAVKLDDLVEQFGLPRPTHIKIDVDGAELQVLQGAQRVLESPTLRTILIELDHSTAEQASALLKDKQLTLVERYRREHKKPDAPDYSLFQRLGAA